MMRGTVVDSRGVSVMMRADSGGQLKRECNDEGRR